MKVERYLPDNIYKGLQAANNPNALNPFLTDSQIPFKLEVSENTVTKTIDNGLLYNFYAVNTGKLAPTGWKVPTKTEFETLIAYLGGDTVAGGLLKTKGTVLADGGWSEPNIGAVDSLNMSILPSGDRYIDGFEYIGFLAGLWTQTSMDVSNAYQFALSFDVSDCIIAPNPKVAGFSVRCLKVTPTAEELLLADGEYATDITDVDGNVYKTIKIGTQVWMGENLKTTQYNDLTPIANVTDNTAWLALTTGAYCSYGNAPIQTYNYLQTGVVKPSTDRLIDSEYIYTDIDKLADVKFSSTNLNDYTKSGNYALDGVYTNAPFNSPNLSGILKISLRNINGSTQIVQSYIHTNITDNNEVGKIWTRVRGTTWTSWKMQLTEDELSTGINLGRTYFISDTEESDTWEAGKTNFKTIGGFLTVFDANSDILHTHFFEGNITNNSDTITNIADTTLYNIGDLVYHTNLQYNSRVVAKTANTLQLSRKATGSSAGATIELKNIIKVIVSGSQTTTLHINRVNLSYHGDAFITHNSNTEYLIEQTVDDLKQPVTYMDSDFTITSIGTKGFIKYRVIQADQRVAYSDFTDFKFKFKNYIGKQNITHFDACDYSSGYAYAYAYNSYNVYEMEYDTVDVIGKWCHGCYLYYSKLKVRMNLTKSTDNCFSNVEYYPFLYDIKGDIKTPANVYAVLASSHYTYVNKHFIEGRAEGKFVIGNGGGIFNVDISNADLVSFTSYDNVIAQLIVTGNINVTRFEVGGAVISNANSNGLYIIGAGGSPIINGVVSSIYIAQASPNPVIINSLCDRDYTYYISLSANREVIFNGKIGNSGYSPSLGISAGIFRNRGTIYDGYYGVQVSGTGKFINEPCGKIKYSRIGIDQYGGNVVQNGKIEHDTRGGVAEICGIKKSGGDLTVGQCATFRVDNGLNPIWCVNNDSASKDVKFKIGCSSNVDMMTAYTGGYAPNPVLTGYSIQVDSNITD